MTPATSYNPAASTHRLAGLPCGTIPWVTPGLDAPQGRGIVGPGGQVVFFMFDANKFDRLVEIASRRARCRDAIGLPGRDLP